MGSAPRSVHSDAMIAASCREIAAQLRREGSAVIHRGSPKACRDMAVRLTMSGLRIVIAPTFTAPSSQFNAKSPAIQHEDSAEPAIPANYLWVDQTSAHATMQLVQVLGGRLPADQ